MHIVFLVGSYYPYYSAVGKCAGNVADELANNNKVTIICLKSNESQDDTDLHNNQNIIRVNIAENKNRNSLLCNIENSNGIKKKINKVLLQGTKLIGFTKTLLSRYTIKKELVNAYSKALLEIKEPIDLIVPTSMPFETVLAAIDYKKKTSENVSVKLYLFDQFALNSNLHRLYINKLYKKRRHILLEKKLFKNCDKILAMHSLKKHLETSHNEFSNKIIYLEHPLITRPVSKFKEEKRIIKVSYIGSLLKNYVEPNYLLKLFSEIKSNVIQLNFYIIGNCDRIVNQYCSIYPRKIINNGRVSKEQADQEIIDSDILISIAEKDGLQMSSKIFEYISNGKPIIHFYSTENDVNLKVLKKYPLCLCLKQDWNNINDNVVTLLNFIVQNRNEVVNYDDVEKLFSDALPIHTADILTNDLK